MVRAAQARTSLARAWAETRPCAGVTGTTQTGPLLASFALHPQVIVIISINQLQLIEGNLMTLG